MTEGRLSSPRFDSPAKGVPAEFGQPPHTQFSVTNRPQFQREKMAIILYCDVS